MPAGVSSGRPAVSQVLATWLSTDVHSSSTIGATQQVTLRRGARHMMLSTAVDQYLQAIEPPVLAKATWIAYRSDLRFLVAVAKVEFTDNVVDFTDELVGAYLRHLKKRGLDQSTLHRRSASVSQLAKWCLMGRLIAVSPHVPRVKRPKRLPRPLGSDTQAKLMALRLTGDELVIRGLLFDAGLRVSEVCTLEIGDVALGLHDGDGRILIHGKGSKERSVPLSPALWHVLRDHILAAGDLERTDRDGKLRAYVIAQPDGKPYSRRMIERRTKRWGKRAEVREVTTPHRFRHRFATELLENGVDLRDIQSLLGHEDVSTTAGYLEVTDRSRRAAINALKREPRGKDSEPGFCTPVPDQASEGGFDASST